MKRTLLLCSLILIGLLGCVTRNVYAQDDEPLTNYEMERLKLAYSAIDQISNMYSNSGYSGEALAQMLLIEQLLKNKDISNPRAAIESLEEVISDICGVTAFMPGDTYRERYFTGRYRSICEWYGNELAELDKSISEEDLAFEKEKVKKRVMTNNIEKQVKKDFIVWNKKKETEKTSAYEQRLREQSVWIFDSICQVALENHWMDNLRYKFMEYDADKEILQMKLWYGDKDGNELTSVIYNIYVSPNLLENLKDHGFRKASIISEGVFQGYLFPIKVSLAPYDSKSNIYRSCFCKAITEGVEPLVIEFDKLNIENNILAGVKRQASFENYYNLYHQLGDSIVRYNKKLRECPGYYKDNEGPKISHKKTLVSYSSNTQIKYNDYKGAVGDDTRKVSENMINPSQESYDEFMNNIILFYNECLPFFDYAHEVNTLFPSCLNRSEKETLDKIKSYVGYYCWNCSDPLKDINIEKLRSLSKAKSTQLKELYEGYCYMIVREKTINKEYSKNQQYFSSEEDFVNAYYLSGDYKAILKERKKQAK